MAPCNRSWLCTCERTASGATSFRRSGLDFFREAVLMMELPRRHAASLKGSRFAPHATTLGDHPLSLVTCVRVSCASNAGKLEVGSHSWRSLFAPAYPGTDFHFRKGVPVFSFFFRPRLGVSGDHRSRLGPLGTNSVRACPRRTQTAPIYSAQFPPPVRKRTKVGRELRDPTQGLKLPVA